MADSDSWDVDNFEPDEPIKTTAVLQDKWEGEDEEDDVKDNWDDEEEEEQKVVVEEEKKTEVKVPEKKKLSAKLKEKENEERKKQEELRNRLQEADVELTPEERAAEKLRLQKLQEESDMALAREAFGIDTAVTTNSASGIEAMCPSTKDDFVVFEKLLKDKISQFEKSVHYSSFLESLFQELCISLEVEDLKKISNSLSVLLTEKQKQEKEKNKNTKKKKKIVLAGGGLKAKQKDDFGDYGDYNDGGYNEYEDFM